MRRTPRARQNAFTLVELLVVIGIIALLISILLPVLGKARRAAAKTVCQSNMRQFGIAMRLYSEGANGFLPTEGFSDGDTPQSPLGPWDDPSFWPNSLPPLLNPRFNSYYDMQLAHASGTQRLPGTGDNSLFVCPLAGPACFGSVGSEVDADGYYLMFGLAPGSTTITGTREQRPTYWCYCYNSGLDNLLNSGSVDSLGTKHIKATNIRPASEVPILVEKLMNPSECLPRVQATLNRGKTKGNGWNSCRLAGRHDGGGNLLFLDGHVGWISRADATTDQAGDGTYNRPGFVIWQPQ